MLSNFHEEKRLKVLILTKWYPTEKNPIAGIFVKELAESIAFRDEVLVLHAFQDYLKKGLYEVLERTDNNIRVIQIKYRKLFHSMISYVLYVILIIKILYKIVRRFKPDVVHVHVFSIGIFAIILKRLYGIPFVVTEHYKIVEDTDTLIGKILNKIKLYVASLVLRQADLIILPSKAMAKEIRRYRLDVENLKIIPNVVNTKIFYPENKKRINKTKKILFVGGLNPVKGLPYLLHALQLVRKKRHDFILEIVGDGPKRLEYEKLASELGISGVVRFLGLKSKTEVAKLMRQCDFLVLPSLWENNPCVLIEAMACGKPVIATSHGGPKEIVKDYCGIIVPPENVNALAEAIEYMLDNSQQYPSHRIILYVKNNFSYEKVGEKLHETYIQIIDNYR